MVKIIVFKAKDGWRWHIKRSGRIIAESGEGYVQRKSCERTLKHLIAAIEETRWVIVHT